MKGLRILGDYILEFVVIVLLAIVSIATIIGFVPMVVGFAGYFSNKKDVRVFKDIFVTIGGCWKTLIPYTIFQLIMILVPVLNIYYFNTHIDAINPFFLGVSYVALVIGGFYLMSAPMVLVNMDVTFFQLLRNGFVMLFAGPVRTLISLLILAAVFLSISYAPYLTIPLLYFAPLFITGLMKENFLYLKAKALGTNVYELKNNSEKDDYSNEK